MNLGQVAYEAYCKSTDGLSLVTGAKLPTWAMLSDRIKQAWIYSAKVVQEEVCKPQVNKELTEAARKGFESA